MAKFVKGQSGNPGGRPKSLLSAVRRIVGDDGGDLVESWRLIAFGTQKQIEAKYGAKATMRERLLAMQELADRGFGRPVQSVEMSGPEGQPIQFEDARQQLAARLATLAARTGASGDPERTH